AGRRHRDQPVLARAGGRCQGERRRGLARCPGRADGRNAPVTREDRMDAQRTPATGAGGRGLAFRVTAGILAVFVIVSNIAFSVPQFFSETDKVHSFHDLASMPAFLILLGFALIVMALRPDDVVAL